MSIAQSLQRTDHVGHLQADRIDVKELVVGNGVGRGQATGSGAWVAFTPTVDFGGTGVRGTVVTEGARYQRVGNTLHFKWVYQQSAAGTAGSGSYFISLPPGMVAVPMGALSNPGEVVGSAMVQSGSTLNVGAVILGGTTGTQLAVVVVSDNNPTATWGSGHLGLNTVGTTRCSLTATLEVR